MTSRSSSRSSTVKGVMHVAMTDSTNEQRTAVLAALVNTYGGRAMIEKWGGGADVWVECTFGNAVERDALWAEARNAVLMIDPTLTICTDRGAA